MFIILLVMCVSVMVSLAPNAGQVGCDFSAFPTIKSNPLPKFPTFGGFEPFDVISMMDPDRNDQFLKFQKEGKGIGDIQHIADEVDVTGIQKKRKEKAASQIGDISDDSNTTTKKDGY